MNWSDLSDKDKAAIKREYESGKEPGDIAPKFGLKPKQVSDQAYRKKWKKKAGAGRKKAGTKKAAKKAGKKKTKKKAGKKAAKKKTKKKAKKRGKKR